MGGHDSHAVPPGLEIHMGLSVRSLLSRIGNPDLSSLQEALEIDRGDFIAFRFPLVLHPDTSGMAHVVDDRPE